jgi:hypothetical protein
MVLIGDLEIERVTGLGVEGGSIQYAKERRIPFTVY